MKKESWFSSKQISATKIKKKASSKGISRIAKKPTRKAVEATFDNQEVKIDLRSFYNLEAKKYSETRKKFRNEEEAILNILNPIFEWDKKIRVLEFWCWSGRFATLLNKNFKDKFDYVGIDLSDELLNYAREDNPNLTFFQWDITKLIKNFEQESFDLVVWTSSFQHIPTSKERSFLMKNFYRILDYDWFVLMTNWSLSNRFMKKNWKAVLKTRLKSLLKFSKSKARDLLVPRTDKNWKVYDRFYHFFSLEELKNLAIFAGLSLKVCTFLDDKWEFTENEKISRSSLFLAKKSPIEE